MTGREHTLQEVLEWRWTERITEYDWKGWFRPTNTVHESRRDVKIALRSRTLLLTPCHLYDIDKGTVPFDPVSHLRDPVHREHRHSVPLFAFGSSHQSRSRPWPSSSVSSVSSFLEVLLLLLVVKTQEFVQVLLTRSK